MRAEDLPALLTRSEAADFLRITTRTLDRKIKDGTIPAVRLGRTIRIRACDLVRLISEG